MLGEIFQRFVEKSPIAVMVRGVLERALDAWYEQTAQKQYTRTLLFSTLYELMSAVVSRSSPRCTRRIRGAKRKWVPRSSGSTTSSRG
jgi:hypothetical protein